jgi:glycosyltransferase involved in cell wall biosynthesis
VTRSKKETPLISVIMPVYNGGPFLQSAIQSILDQTYQNFELLIIDDCSKDNSPEVVRSFKDPRIHFVQNTKNLGLAGNRNKALGLAKGEFIAIMDNDDLSHPRRLELQLEAFLQDPTLSLCGSWAEVINDDNEVLAQWKFPTDSLALKAQFYIQFPVVHTSAMMRFAHLKELPYFYDLKLEWAEDYDLLFRMTHNHNIRMIPENLVQYRVHQHNNSADHKLTYKNQLIEIFKREYELIGLSLSREEIKNFALFLNPKHGPASNLFSALKVGMQLHQTLKRSLQISEKQLGHWNIYLLKTFILNCKKNLTVRS